METVSVLSEETELTPVIPADRHWPKQMKLTAVDYLKRYDSCTQAILWAFMESLAMKNKMVLRVSGAMQGGMMSSLTCGVHTAGLMILGMGLVVGFIVISMLMAIFSMNDMPF